MRERKLRPGQASIERVEPGPDSLTLTKIEVARRELTSAIAMFFAQSDPVAIHVLVSAASEILERLNEGAGNQTFMERLRVGIKDEFQDAWGQLVVEAYNFMKHAGKDPEAVYERFNPKINKMLLLGAVLNYWQVAKPTSIMLLFLAWHAKTSPEMIIPGNDVLDQMVREASNWPDDPVAALRQAHDVVKFGGLDRI